MLIVKLWSCDRTKRATMTVVDNGQGLIDQIIVKGNLFIRFYFCI